VRIHSITIYKTAEGYKLRLEGEDIGKNRQRLELPNIKTLFAELKLLVLEMVVEKIDTSLGRPMTETEAEQVRNAQTRADAAMGPDPPGVQRPLEIKSSPMGLPPTRADDDVNLPPFMRDQLRAPRPETPKPKTFPPLRAVKSKEEDDG